MEYEAIEKAIGIVPDRRLSSLYDVATLYTACDVYDRFTSEYVTWDLSPDVLRVMSPEKLSDLYDPENSNSIIAARVDLSGKQPELADPPVTVENLTEEMKYEIGFMSRDKTSSQTDYSISNHSNGDDVETLAHDTWGNRFLRGRFEVWPFEVDDDLVEDSSILQALRTLGDDEDAMEKLEKALNDTATFDETEAIVTVKLRLEPDGEYLYPGKIPDLNRAGLQNRYEHIRDGLSVDDAHGEGVGFVSGKEGEVLGGSGGIRGQYSKLQTDRFPNMQNDDAWLARPLKEEQAIAVSNFDSFASEFSFVRNGVRLYYLPYPQEPVTAERFERFYTEVYSPLRNADSSSFIQKLIDIYTTQVQDEQEESDTDSPLDDIVDFEDTYDSFSVTDSWLRLYGLMYVGGTDPSRVFIDNSNVSLDTLTAVDDAYTETLSDVGSNRLFGEVVNQLDYYLPTAEGIVYELMYGTLFERITAKSPDPDDEVEENEQATSDDVLFSRYARVLSGDTISASPLIREFVSLIQEEQRSNQSESREPIFPARAVLSQYLVLRTLSISGLISEKSIISDGLSIKSMLSAESDGDYESRDDRLEDFIQSHPMLKDSEARSVFLLGGLVGRLSAYQYSEGISQKVTEQYPPSAVSRRSLPDVTQDVLDRTYTYGDKDDISSFNRRYTDRLADSMLAKPPSDWNLSESEVKWIYSLGIAYGKQDSSKAIDYNDSDDSDSEQE
jgi:hypothetical protein